jgi:ABC-2 type transporter
MAFVTKTVCSVRIVSLLQPPPETVANFDEIVLLSEGKIIFSGPIERIIPYFQNLGYEIPQRMDLADFLQMLPTKDGWRFLRSASDPDAKRDDFISQHLDTDAFHERFYASDLGVAILEKLNGPVKGEGNHFLEDVVKVRYANPWYKSMKLLVKRELTLWWRNKVRFKRITRRCMYCSLRRDSHLLRAVSIEGEDLPE